MARRRRAGRGRTADRAVLAASLVWVGALALVRARNAAGPEQWRWAALNLFLPQWFWGVPGLVLLVWTLRRARRWAWLPAAGIAWVAGPAMGFRWPSGGAAVPAGAVRLRVMTYNVEGHPGRADVAAEVAAADPDLVLMQEAGEGRLSGDTALLLRGWHRAGPKAGLLIASRFPLRDVRLRAIPEVSTYRGYLRCRLRVRGRDVTVCCVHLPTPREGLAPLAARGSEAAPEWQASINARLTHAVMLARELRGEPEPRLVAGDLNAPVESMICRYLLAIGLRDAFDLAGAGYGYTYGHTLPVRHSYVRIDHVLVGREWGVRRCRTGGAGASDHRPVIADLWLPPAR